MSRLPCDPPELRTLFLFEKLTDHQLEQLCEKGHVELIEPGPVFAEGEIATCFYVLIEGELVLSKLSGGEEIEFNRTSQRGVYSGAWQSYLGDRAPQTYTASMRVTAPSKFFVLDADRFGQLMREWFPMAVHLLEGLFFGNQNAKQVVDQRERLLALGSLSAGLTHELNNPAAAAVRATASLRDRVSHMRQKLGVIASGVYDRQALATLIRLQEETAELVAKAPTLSPLEASDREDELGDWFDDHGVSGGWDLAPTFVQAGLDVPWLERIVASVDDAAMVESAIRWLNYTIETELLMNEIADSTARVSTLVNAAKQYSQMDRAPYQRIDLRELLDSSLVMLGRKIGDSIAVVKEYDPTLPQIPAYAAELNQVWTNLIDNAVAAMNGHGTLTVRTRRDGDMALIEIGDTGPGVPEEIRSRIFEPFFTTKPVGEGTGLGLDISWRIVVKKHRGDLRVESEPGDTRFQVRIPIEPEVAAAEGVTDG
ncbi:histidine kinase [Rhodococcus sp. ACS1]|uniref:histidine kinase n=1 Tax=Rhodococcus koreensis TaxID=99653 RepID=A0A1H4UME0_9NOCA|nr:MULTISPECIES: ATP-binding protein [Rhodococcus]PBC45672.1 histidine kinase [Rhodococcus sp. ACS1]QSE81625.1 cyclic nucleotide-binding domain-containing protein [Rhodococcus koreensis]SEC70072.1 Cyclic nucleotide-binding domain-containing protein [Rhodococcus koreensis]